MSAPRLLTPQDVADQLQKGRKWVVAQAAGGVIPALKVGGSWRFKQADIDAYIDGLADPDNRWGLTARSKQRAS